MTSCSYRIAGGDYDRAGSASRNLKEVLKSLGVDAQAVRRLMIAAYEAEMNVVIHAYGGTLNASIEPGHVQVQVVDQGPGIPDIELAMKEGWSTAPAKARDLGFGAGLGLPNIRRHSDTFSLETKVGEGTTVSFGLAFESQQSATHLARSMRLRGERCRQCHQCVHVCPTQAIRVFRNTPSILAHLCIECGSCIRVCPSGAIDIEESQAPVTLGQDDTLLLSASHVIFAAGNNDPSRLFAALKSLEAGAVRLLSDWDTHLSVAMHCAADASAHPDPLISPACPAVTNLIATRFPSLLDDISGCMSGLQAAITDLGPNVWVAVSCPAQRSEALAAGVPSHHILSPRQMRELLMPKAKGAPTLDRLSARPADCWSPIGMIRVTGMRDVGRTLEDLENGLLGDLSLVEPFACQHGCFGAGLNRELNAAIAEHRWNRISSSFCGQATTHLRTEAPSPRPGIRLDADMAEAMSKLNRIDQLTRSLPGHDCGQCGAPSCRAFAEDVVLDRIARRACPFAAKSKEVAT